MRRVVGSKRTVYEKNKGTGNLGEKLENEVKREVKEVKMYRIGRTENEKARESSVSYLPKDADEPVRTLEHTRTRIQSRNRPEIPTK